MKKKLPNNNDHFKAVQLSRHKALATGLFILMALIYILCIYLMRLGSATWLGYLKAFAEAAMVGALADWFAVTALFHHPLGIPIPHTNLIENKKKQIGDNLGGFVAANFLNAETIRPYIEKINISSIAAGWLKKEKNVMLLTNEITWLLKGIVEKTDDKAVTKFITKKSKEALGSIHLNEAFASGLTIIMQRGDLERVIGYIADKLKNYITENEALVRQKVKEESHFLIPGFVDNIIAAKITNGAMKYLQEIQTDPTHKIRNDITHRLLDFIEEVRTQPKWKQELLTLKDGLMAGNKVEEYAASVWISLKNSLLNDLTEQRSGIKLYVKKSINELAKNLESDESLRNKINGWIRFNAYRYALKSTTYAEALISNTVGNWEGAELSNKLELEVGKDLQYIRINGTLVGGIVGLIIYTITKLFT